MPTYRNDSSDRICIDINDILPGATIETIYQLDLTNPKYSGFTKTLETPYFNLVSGSDAITGTGTIELVLSSDTQKIEIFNKTDNPVDMYINDILNTPKLIIHKQSICKINEDVHLKLSKLIFVPTAELADGDFYVHQFKSFWVSFEN